MKRMMNVGSTVACAFVLGACMQTTGELRPAVADQATQVVSTNSVTGTPYVRSRQPSSVVAVQQVQEKGYESLGAIFDLKVANVSGAAVPLGPKYIVVRQGNQSFEVMGLEEAQAKIKSQETAKQVFAVIGMLGAAVGGGLAARSGGNTAALVLPAATMMIQSSASAMARSSGNIMAFDDEASEVFLTSETLPPQSKTGGLFAVSELSPSQATSIDVTVGSDVHKFVFEPKK
jgi:hypothetical protein